MNISEIAKMAGVSNAAVSRYFNDGYISEEKRERIRKAVEETGYIPSAQAQTLRTKRTKLIGVILPKINSDSISRIVAGISEQIAGSDYELLLGNTNNNEKKELEYLRIFDQNRVDGIIYVATMFGPSHRKLLRELKVPLVIVGQRLPGYNCIYHDDEQAAYDLAETLITGGCRSIGYIGVTMRDKAVGKSRYEGFARALKGHGMECPKDMMEESSFSIEAGYESAKHLIARAEPDGLFCVTDSIAIGAMMYLRELKKKIPGEIQLIGFGDNRMAKVSVPQLTTVHFSYKTSGIEAARILMSDIQGDAGPPREIKMGYRIVQGQTTKAPKRR